jgi:hypothetical protein
MAEDDETPSVSRDGAPDFKRIKYQDDHREIYAEDGMQWPPSKDACPELDRSGFHHREVEVVIYFHTKYFPFHNESANVSKCP